MVKRKSWFFIDGNGAAFAMDQAFHLVMNHKSAPHVKGEDRWFVHRDFFKLAPLVLPAMVKGILLLIPATNAGVTEKSRLKERSP